MKQRAAPSNFISLLTVLILLAAWLSRPISVWAADACSASVTPGEVTANSEVAFTVTINNTGTTTGLYILLNAPSSNFSLINYGVDGWSVGTSSSSMELWGGSIAAGASMQFQVGASVGGDEAAAANWGVNVSFGGEYVGCGGGRGSRNKRPSFA